MRNVVRQFALGWSARLVWSFLLGLGLGLAACSEQETNEGLGLTEAALTAAQCNFFVDDGKITIGHFTNNKKKPFTIIKTNLMGCISGHSIHAKDFVEIEDDQDCRADRVVARPRTATTATRARPAVVIPGPPRGVCTSAARTTRCAVVRRSAASPRAWSMAVRTTAILAPSRRARRVAA